MTPEPDYPAAHSMDTEWYAVDRDGHVGIFFSGEAGAVPDAAEISEAPDRGQLAAALPVAPFRLRDWLGDSGEEQHRELPERKPVGTRGRKSHRRKPPARSESLGPTLLFLDSLDHVRAEVGRYEVEHAPASEGVAVRFRDLPVETAYRLHQTGACLGCFAWHHGPFFSLGDDALRRQGVFLYEHADEAENWIAGPYTRGPMPGLPLRVDQLPPGMREALGRVRFESISFVETERLQPVLLVACSVWGDAYLDPDGRTIRPVPGREGEFDAEAWAGETDFRVELTGPQPPNS